jgi:MFS family permease
MWREDDKALYLLYVSILPLMICSGMVYSILAVYLNSQLGATTTIVGFIYMVGSASGAVFSPMVGKLSDRIGRKPIMTFSMVGFMVAFSAYAFIESFVQAFPIQALEGLTWAAMGAAVTAFIADIVPSEKRGWAMGMYERTWFIGWIIGPVLGGYIADVLGFKTTFLMGSALLVLGLTLMVLFVKENKKDVKRNCEKMEIKIKREDFEVWLNEEHKASFRNPEQVKDFVGQGMAFLFVSGSNLLKSYILRNIKLVEGQEQLLRTLEGQTYLWWIFSQTVEELHCSKDEVTIVYKPKEKYKPYIRY